MSEENEEPDWLAELAKGGEALQREAMRIVKAAEEFAATSQAGRSRGGSYVRWRPASANSRHPSRSSAT